MGFKLEMKQKHVWILILFLVIVGCAHPQILTAPWHKKVSGTISEINRDDYRFALSSPRSETGVMQVFQFKTDASTRYAHAAGFSDLGIDDWAAVDFIQNDKGEFVAENITLRKRAPEEPPKKSENQKHGFLE